MYIAFRLFDNNEKDEMRLNKQNSDYQLWTRITDKEKEEIKKFMADFGHLTMASATRALILKGLEHYYKYVNNN